MQELDSYRIFPLGDSAITLDLGNQISESINQKIIALFQSCKENHLPGMIEAVPAYSSLTIYYDVFSLHKIIPPNRTVYEWMEEQLENRIKEFTPVDNPTSRLIKIPVCYEMEFAPDIEELSSVKKISIEEIIKTHTSKTYRVYLLGFLPGFAYMGEVEQSIEMPRRNQPRQQVEAGSVGIAGKQTGIYPLVSPGGWQIIGRTPLKLFEASPQTPLRWRGAFEDSFCLLHPGDTVEFYSISKDEFEGLSKGEGF